VFLFEFCFRDYFICLILFFRVSVTVHYQEEGSEESDSETPIVWRNTSDTFTPRGLGYNRASCELVKLF